MPLVNDTGRAEAALQRYIAQELYYRRPYLVRNLRRSLHSLSTTQSIMPTPRSPRSLKRSKEVMQQNGDLESISEDEDDEVRAMKRRKIRDLEVPNESRATRFISESPRRRPLQQVANDNYRSASKLGAKLQPVKPSSFYGPSALKTNSDGKNFSKERSEKQMSTKTVSIDEKLFGQRPAAFAKALQVHVEGVDFIPGTCRDSSQFMGGRRGPLNMNCECEITIYGELHDSETGESFQTGVLHKESKMTVLRSEITDDNVRRKVVMEPFLVTADKLYIPRKAPGKLSQVLGLADDYFADLRFYKGSRQWPPFDIPLDSETDGDYVRHMIQPGTVTDLYNRGEASGDALELSCRWNGILTAESQDKPATLNLCFGKAKQIMRNEFEGMRYDLRVTAKWSLPSSRHASPSNSHSAALANAEKEEGTSRLLRSRSSKPGTYNLEALSTQAQSLSLKEASYSSSASVTYILGAPDSSDCGKRPKTTHPGNFCLFCSRGHTSLNTLRMHLITDHSSFTFTLGNSDTAKTRLFVELSGANRSPSTQELQQIIQIGRPQTLFDMEKFLRGDKSWLKARKGPLHNRYPANLMLDGSSQCSSTDISRESSPNTPISVNNDYLPIVKLPNKRRKPLLVPETTTKWYDTVTKRVLEPGEEIPSSDDEKDEGWLFQRHQDAIMLSKDNTENEKDYMTQWNPHIMRTETTCVLNLPNIALTFVDENLEWFTSNKCRKVEFGKHMATFIMRGVLQQKTLDKAISKLRKAEEAAASKKMENFPMKTGHVVDGPIQSREAIRPRRAMFHCECGEFAPLGDRKVCKNNVILKFRPLYDLYLLIFYRIAQPDTFTKSALHRAEQKMGNGGVLTAGS